MCRCLGGASSSLARISRAAFPTRDQHLKGPPNGSVPDRPRDLGLAARSVSEIVKQGQALSTTRIELGEKVAEVAWQTDLSAARRHLAGYGGSFLRLFNRDYREAVATLKGVLKGSGPAKTERAAQAPGRGDLGASDSHDRWTGTAPSAKPVVMPSGPSGMGRSRIGGTWRRSWRGTTNVGRPDCHMIIEVSWRLWTNLSPAGIRSTPCQRASARRSTGSQSCSNTLHLDSRRSVRCGQRALGPDPNPRRSTTRVARTA